MLCTISDLYKLNRRFEESREILLLAYERHPGGRMIVYSLCELSIKLDDVVQAVEYYKEKEVNMFFFVPSILVNIANMDILKTCRPEFTKILFAGEVMPTKQLNYWIKHYPNTLFSNLYGPTEITVDCTFYTVDRKFEDNEPLPIGKKCRNSDVIISLFC